MRTPIFNLLALALPLVTGAGGYWFVRTAKGATNLGEAIGPWFAAVIFVTLAAAVGEVAAVISVVRGERMGWLSWVGVAVNGVLLLPTIYLLLTADWS
jgi:hypothetical protein